MDNEWLKYVKAGSEVAVSGGWHGDEIERVDRVTSTQVIIGHARYRRSDGKKMGTSRFYHRWLKPVTPEVKAATYERKIRADIARVQWDKVPLTVLVEILDKIPEPS